MAPLPPPPSPPPHHLTLDTVGGTTKEGVPIMPPAAAARDPQSDDIHVAKAHAGAGAGTGTRTPMDERMERVRAKIEQEAAEMASASPKPETAMLIKSPANGTRKATGDPRKAAREAKNAAGQHPSLATEAVDDEYDDRMFRRSHHRVLDFFGLGCCVSVRHGRHSRHASEPTHVTSITMNVKDDMFGFDQDAHSDDLSSVFSGWSEGKDTIVSTVNQRDGTQLESRAQRPQPFLFFCGTEHVQSFQPKKEDEEDRKLEGIDMRALPATVEQRELPMFFSPSTPRDLAACTPRTSMLASRSFSFQGETMFADDEIDAVDGTSRGVTEQQEEA